MEICSIASGSSGNCIYVGSEKTHVLIDAGISGRRIEAGLNEIGRSTKDLSAILITHEHSDHIASLGMLSRKLGIPVYATKGTLDGVMNAKNMGPLDTGLFNVVKAEEEFCIEDLLIKPIKVSHDANEPVAYRINHGNSSVGVCTDLGTYDERIVEGFSGINALLLEANHDVNMLQVGRYPYYLKQRILGDRGHLSNENCGRLLCRLLHDDLKAVYLGHLSHENNLAELAYEAVRLEILMDECCYSPNDFEIKVAKRDEISELIAV